DVHGRPCGEALTVTQGLARHRHLVAVARGIEVHERVDDLDGRLVWQQHGTPLARGSITTMLTDQRREEAPVMELDIPIIDCDSHLAEPPDLWTSRMDKAKWGDAIPHLEFDERVGMERWVVGGKKLTSVANWAVAGWPEHPPSHPPS